MTTTETNNKLIAEFMGYKLTPCNNGLAWDIGKSIPSHEHLFPLQGVLHTGNELNFHTSWDWLMLVVDKIENCDGLSNEEVITIEYKDCIIPHHQEEVRIEGANSKLEAVYNAVVEFIKYYNLKIK